MKNINITKILIIVLVFVIFTSVYSFVKINSVQNSSEEVERQRVVALVEEVGKIIMLPQGELPSVAIVDDVEKVKDQPFFAKAKEGDYILIFNNARKAYLYDAVEKKIKEIAPVNFESNTN